MGDRGIMAACFCRRTANPSFALQDNRQQREAPRGGSFLPPSRGGSDCDPMPGHGERGWGGL